MANDPALAADTMTFLEAVAGDNGVHSATGAWWLSPDIQLNGSVSGIDKADPGVDNTVDVTIHAAAANGVYAAGAESITIQLFVANPSLVMAPDNPQSTTQIDSIGMPLLAAGGTATYQFHWVPPSVPASDPQAPGHKCLVARAYSDPLTPSDSNFFAPEDRHVAQHNICIVPCGGPGAARKPAGCGTPVNTVNVSKKPQRARLRATRDADPSKTVREIVLARLKRVKGFQRLASRGPKSFGFQFTDIKSRDIALPKLAKGMAVESEVLLQPEQFITFRFAADLSGGKLGEAHVFHLTHASDGGHVEGGLTVVLLAI